MTHEDTLRNIDYLREKADVTYEEALELLEKFDGNVMRVLVELERKGRVYATRQQDEETPPHYTHAAHEKQREKQAREKAEKAGKQASNFITRALEHRLVVESGKGDQKRTVANLSAPYVAGAAVVAPHLAVASVALMFVMGYRVKVEKTQPGPIPENVETFVDNTVSNIKRTADSLKETASSFKESARSEPKSAGTHPTGTNPVRHDDDDEGGEITIE